MKRGLLFRAEDTNHKLLKTKGSEKYVNLKDTRPMNGTNGTVDEEEFKYLCTRFLLRRQN
jgi:hypothetical protein